MSMPPTEAELEQQVRVSKMLGFGFALSIAYLLGVGSLLALIIGLRARKMIKQSNGVIAGIGMAWWCIIAGALGILVAPFFIFEIFTRLTR